MTVPRNTASLSLPRLCRTAALATAALCTLSVAPIANAASCRLGSAGDGIRHVIYIQFDNTHLLRDNPSVPSDLEQMPHLLRFIRDNGTLLANDHTVLISHTAGGILSTLTGLYPDRHGQTVSNSYVRTSSTGAFSFPSSFGYWTDAVASANTPTVPNMVMPDGRTVPAPWVAFTRAGCDVGAIASANIVLENTGTGATGDITKVFGNPSPQFEQALASNNAAAGTAARAKAQTDFVGFAIHCARGSSICANGHDDLLPDEPGGYNDYKGLFGAQEINPSLTGGPVLTDLLGSPITDPFGQPGFPGFDGMSAAVTLAYVAAMHEKGIPITFAYISDAHDFHGVSGDAHNAFGPGDAGYVEQLKAYDDAFAAFFARLAANGITRKNTLFVFTVDEGDHYTGVAKTNCDGIVTPCVYGSNEVGEINANIDTLVAEQFPSLASQFLGSGAPNAFTVHGDDAPTFYLARPGSGQLAQTDPLTRQFERSIAKLTAVNPYTGVNDRLVVRMADQTAMKALHMHTTGDAARNPTFVLFADANYFITDFPASTCKTCINPAFAWNHGDVQPEIAQTWLGLVGPGVRSSGDSEVWTDHADVRPTMLALLGLEDSYAHDGRAIVEAMTDRALPRAFRASHPSRGALQQLGEAYKQVNAPFGAFAQDLLTASTRALAGGSTADDASYLAMQRRIETLTRERDALADDIKELLHEATIDGDTPPSRMRAKVLTAAANRLLVAAHELATESRVDAPITLAVFGDWPYSQPLLDAAPLLIGSINADRDVSGVLHVGDIHSGSMPCTGAGLSPLPSAAAPLWNAGIYELFQQFDRPLVYTPGDNEWTDCHKTKEGSSGYPMNELAAVRSLFFPARGFTLGAEKKTVLSQALAYDRAHPSDAQFVENVMWQEAGVYFVTLNVPGSNNDTLPWTEPFSNPAAQAEEVADRNAANLRWLSRTFAEAKAGNARAVVIALQADMWDPAALEVGGDGLYAYTPFVRELANLVVELGRPVLLINGDSHVYGADHPLADPNSATGMIHGTQAVTNLARITVQGSTNTPREWLRLTIDPDSTQVFSWQNVVYCDATTCPQ